MIRKTLLAVVCAMFFLHACSAPPSIRGYRGGFFDDGVFYYYGSGALKQFNPSTHLFETIATQPGDRLFADSVCFTMRRRGKASTRERSAAPLPGKWLATTGSS